jgi:hypothetical protein
MLLVHHADHLLPLGCDRLLSNEVARGEERDCGLFTVFRNDGDFCAILLR